MKTKHLLVALDSVASDFGCAGTYEGDLISLAFTKLADTLKEQHEIRKEYRKTIRAAQNILPK